MAAKVSSSSHEEQITSLNPEDVVSGRGSGANEWIGNRTFRLVVDSRRNDYLTAESQAEKTQVAQEVYDTIKLRKGRFLVRVDHAKSFVLEDGIWKELTEAAAIEKCKQVSAMHVLATELFSIRFDCLSHARSLVNKSLEKFIGLARKAAQVEEETKQ